MGEEKEEKDERPGFLDWLVFVEFVVALILFGMIIAGIVLVLLGYG